MELKFVNIGYGNIVAAHKVVAVVSPESASIRRTIQEAKDHHLLVDATYGRKTRAVIFTDSGHMILTALQPETVANRLNTPDYIIDEHEK